MEECSHLSGHMYNICTGNANMDKWKIDHYRKIWGLEPLYDESKPLPSPNIEPVVINKLNVHDFQHMVHGDYEHIIPGPGTQLLKLYKDSGVPPCNACFELALKMNGWGPDGCKENMDAIILDIFPRALSWIKENKSWVHKLLPDVVEETAIKMKITSDVNKAINTAREELKDYKPKKVAPKRINPPVRKGGCSCGKRK